MAYIGLDVGTSGCKAAVVSENGNILSVAHREYSFVCPAPGYVELDPLVVWNCVFSTLKEAAAFSHDIRYIAVASIGEAMVILDKNDKPLVNGITYLDQRCNEIVKEIGNYFDLQKLYSISGVPLNQMFSLNKYIWLERNMPDVIEKADKYFLFGDFLTYMLSGERTIDPSTAARTMFFDSLNLKWSDEIADSFKIPLEKFSKVVLPGTVVGKIRKSLAKETGLPENLTVVMGCHDQGAASLGSGAIAEGDIMAGEGSTESINLVIDKKRVNENFKKHNLCFEPYVEPELYQTFAGQLTHATCIRWFIKNFGADFGDVKDIPGESIYDRADRGCAADSGSLFFLPYLSSVSCMDADHTALGGFLGADISADRAKMYRALLEGLSFETKQVTDVLKGAGLKINNMVASGGCSKSELYMQIKADILQQPIRILSNPEAGVIGLAMMCSKADNRFASYREMAKDFVKVSRTYSPKNNYSEKYLKYRKMSRAVIDLYKNM